MLSEFCHQVLCLILNSHGPDFSTLLVQVSCFFDMYISCLTTISVMRAALTYTASDMYDVHIIF